MSTKKQHKLAMITLVMLLLQMILGLGFSPPRLRQISANTPCSYRQPTELHGIAKNAITDRRDIMGSLLTSGFSIFLLDSQQKANAVLPTKPFAPTSALIPAARVKLTIEKAIALASTLADGDNTSNTDTLSELESLILKPQNYCRGTTLQGVPAKPSQLYLDSYKPMKGDLPLQRILIQSGDVITWKNLKRKEKEQEQSSEVRAALNAYTDALSFDPERYLLNVDSKTRSKMVREDRLPDVKQVITSDMGMRYLYRNQVLEGVEDVKAELEFQLKDESSLDGKELVDLLVKADKALDRWFALIDENGVREAFDIVEKEIE